MIKAKVVHIITRMELGGAQENTLFSVSHINPETFETFLVTGRGGELYNEAREFKNTFIAPDLIREIKPAQDIKAFFQILTILKNIKNLAPPALPVIVHTHSSKAGILGRWAAKAAGLPILLHSIHGFGFNDYQPFAVRFFYWVLERITSPITTKFIAVSQANIEKGLALKIFPSTKAVLIRSGIDIKRFQQPELPARCVKKSLGIPDTAPVVAMIACFKPQKAPLDFVRACALVHKNIPKAHFLLIGDGELRSDIEAEILALNLPEVFHLTGWRRDVPELLHAADVFALSSLWEGLPRVLPQAMCAGIPIVATKVDGSPEAVRDGINGFLIHPGAIIRLAEKILFCLNNPEQAREMGSRGKSLVEEFDMHTMIKDQENLYSELVQNLK
ncbi:MAG: glycosyltransferase family 4 protein [Pseudomonadota bacterium]